jgi:porin
MKISIALTLTLLATALPVLGDDAAEHGIWTRDKLLGDIGGLRSALGEHGIGVNLRLSQYYQGVTSGGVDTNAEYGGTMDYIVNVDGHKLGLWPGLLFNLHATTRFGNDVLADAGGLTLPNTGLMYPLPGDYDDTQVTGLLAMQTLAGGRATAAFGKLNVVDLVDMLFPHLAVAGQDGFLNVSSLVSALPWFRFIGLSMWGGGAWLNTERGIEGGLVFYGLENVTNTWEFTGFEDGVGMAGFWRWFYDIGGKPGYFLLLAGGATKDYNSLDPTDWSPTYSIIAQTAETTLLGFSGFDKEQKKPWDVAAYIYQVLWQAEHNPKRNATLFVGGTGGPDNPQFGNWNIFAALEAKGPIASRPNDRMGVAGFYNGLSNDLEDLGARAGIELRDLWGFEMYYNIALTPAVHVTPDIQFLENENEGDDLAVVPGVRLTIDF